MTETNSNIMNKALIKLQTLNKNGRVCFYVQAVMVSVLVKTEAFTINGSDGVSGGACFYPHAVVVCFSKATGVSHK